MVQRLWIDIRRRTLAWLIAIGLLITGLAMAAAYLANWSDYQRFSSSTACDNPSIPSVSGCHSDLSASVSGVVYNPGGAHSAPSGEITVRLNQAYHTLHPVNGDDATRFKTGDRITARVWAAQIVELRSADNTWIYLSDTPVANNSGFSGLALAGIGLGGSMTAILFLGARHSRSRRRA